MVLVQELIPVSCFFRSDVSSRLALEKVDALALLSYICYINPGW